MIDVGHKSVTLRTAEASGSLLLRPMTLEHIRAGKLAKGDAINTACLLYTSDAADEV